MAEIEGPTPDTTRFIEGMPVSTGNENFLNAVVETPSGVLKYDLKRILDNLTVNIDLETLYTDAYALFGLFSVALFYPKPTYNPVTGELKIDGYALTPKIPGIPQAEYETFVGTVGTATIKNIFKAQKITINFSFLNENNAKPTQSGTFNFFIGQNTGFEVESVTTQTNSYGFLRERPKPTTITIDIAGTFTQCGYTYTGDPATFSAMQTRSATALAGNKYIQLVYLFDPSTFTS